MSGAGTTSGTALAPPVGADPDAGAEPEGAEPAAAEPAGAEPVGAEPAGADPGAGADTDDPDEPVAAGPALAFSGRTAGSTAAAWEEVGWLLGEACA